MYETVSVTTLATTSASPVGHDEGDRNGVRRHHTNTCIHPLAPPHSIHPSGTPESESNMFERTAIVEHFEQRSVLGTLSVLLYIFLPTSTTLHISRGRKADLATEIFRLV